MEKNLTFRLFAKQDVANKVQWVNDAQVNQFLHYDLPLCPDRTLNWYQKIIHDSSRADFVFETKNASEQAVALGLIGLLNIDRTHSKAEFYILLGNKNYWGQNIAFQIASEFLDYAFKKYRLNKVYLYTEEENLRAQRLFERIGFSQEGLLQSDLIYMGKEVNRYVYRLLRKDFYHDQG